MARVEDQINNENLLMLLRCLNTNKKTHHKGLYSPAGSAHTYVEKSNTSMGNHTLAYQIPTAGFAMTEKKKESSIRNGV